MWDDIYIYIYIYIHIYISYIYENKIRNLSPMKHIRNVFFFRKFFFSYILILQSNIFASTWFSSAQNSCITKFLVNFCDKIPRAHTVLARSKMQEKQNFLRKRIQCFIGERNRISFSYRFFRWFCFLFPRFRYITFESI